jgi:hypothetical protein
VTLRRAVARGLASAFLDGGWTRDGLMARGADALGEKPRWMAVVVRRVLLRFSRPPHARPRELAMFIASLRTLRRALGNPTLAPHIRHAHLPIPRMGTSPWPVPVIPTAGDLAYWLEVTPAQLYWLADPNGMLRTVTSEALTHYRYRWLPKPSGGVRLLERPKPRLKRLQRRILTGILDLIPPHPAAHGFRKNHSALTFVQPHVARHVVTRLDLADFFPSIPAARVRAIFRHAGYPDEVAHILTALCTNCVPQSLLMAGALPLEPRRRFRVPHLPQGAPTSPALANLAAFRFDVRLSAVAASLDARYTRYADDLAFSGNLKLATAARRFEVLVGAIAIDEGFRVNFRKTRVLRQGVRQKLAGIVVNHHPNLPRQDFDRLKATLTNCVRLGPATQNRDGHRDFRAHLQGRIAWATQLNAQRGARLRRLFDAIAWS